MAAAAQRRSQDGFVNVNLPIELDCCVDELISKRLGNLVFSKKKIIWQSAVEHWLKMRPDRRAGVPYLHTQATTSRAGRTGFIQRRVELGSDLELRVRRLALELADEKGRPFALARIIYTALDYYVRHITTSAASGNKVPQTPDFPEDNFAVGFVSDPVTFQIDATGLDTTRIVSFIEKMAIGPVNIQLTLTLEKAAARHLLSQMMGNQEIKDDSLISVLSEHLALQGKFL